MKHSFSVFGGCLLAFVTGVLVSVGAVAHHSPAAFDQTAEVDIEGTVTDLSWSNPHITMTLEVVGPDGEKYSQEVEAASVTAERAAGVSKEMIPIGSNVVVRAHPSRLGPRARVNGLSVTMSDGSRIPLHASAGFYVAAEVRARTGSLAGSWAPRGGEFTRAAGEMQKWPFTEQARAALVDAFSRTGNSLGVCTDLPPPVLSIFPNFREIEIGETSIVMRFENEGRTQERIVHMDRKEHSADTRPSLLGHSIGWWDGESLVVDTAAFTPDPNGVFGWVPSGPAKHLVERFTLEPSQRHLRYEVTLDDPESLTEPASVSMLWDYRPDLEPSGVACDPHVAERLLHDETE